MTGVIFTNLVVALPWIIGAFITLSAHEIFAQKGKSCNTDTPDFELENASAVVSDSGMPRALVIGAGGFIGYCVWGVLLLSLNQLGFKPFQEALIWALLFFTISATIIWFTVNKNFDQVLSAKQGRIFSSFPSFLILLVIILITYQTTVPVVAWDALHYWAIHAERFILSSLIDYPGAEFSGDLGHPPMIIVILAWSGWVSEYLGNSQVSTPWMLNGISLLLITYGAALLLLRNRIISSVLALCVLTLPLVEQHLSLAGYAEAWLSSGVLLSVSLLMQGFKVNNIWMISWGLIAAFILLFIKNTGFLYASVIWAAVLLTLVFPAFARAARTRPRETSLIFLATIFLFYLVAAAAIESCTEATCFISGSYVLSAEGFSVEEMIFNERHSLFINASFSVSGLIIVIGTWGIISHVAYRSSIDQDLIFIYSATIFLLLIPILTQLFLYDFWLGRLYATPTNDTGNSRLTIPFAVVSVTLFARLCLECESDVCGHSR